MSDWLSQFNTFRFASPWWLLALLLIPLAMWLVGRVGHVSAVQFSSGALLHAAARKSRFSPGRYRPMLRHLALSFLIIALARPQVDKGLTDREALGINIMFVLDFSSTMKTRDFLLEGKRVSRVDAMKRMVSEFIKARESDRIGAVYFDIGAHLISPLTLDHEWLLAQVADAEANRGTAPGSGMLIAAEALLPAKDQTKVHRAQKLIDQPRCDHAREPLARTLCGPSVKHCTERDDQQDRPCDGRKCELHGSLLQMVCVKTSSSSRSAPPGIANHAISSRQLRCLFSLKADFSSVSIWR